MQSRLLRNEDKLWVNTRSFRCWGLALLSEDGVMHRVALSLIFKAQLESVLLPVGKTSQHIRNDDNFRLRTKSAFEIETWLVAAAAPAAAEGM